MNTQMTTTIEPARDSHIQDHYQHMPEDAPAVPHMTIPAFLRSVDYKWNMLDIERFGAKVGRTAESLHVSFTLAFDRSLGNLRAFPVPMLRRIYDLMAPGFGWPAVIWQPSPSARVQEDPAESASEAEAELEVRATVRQYLEMLAGSSKQGRIRSCARRMLHVVERECEELRAAAPEAERVPATVQGVPAAAQDAGPGEGGNGSARG